jgi:hypothetical protein
MKEISKRLDTSGRFQRPFISGRLQRPNILGRLRRITEYLKRLQCLTFRLLQR